MNHTRGLKRSGLAAIELAVLLPLLMFLFVISIDFSRVFYYSQILENCARNGAIHGSNLSTTQSPYESIEEAALASADSLEPQPTVTSNTGYDIAGNPYIKVQVDWQFQTVTGFPGVPNTVNLSRTVQMRVVPN